MSPLDQERLQQALQLAEGAIGVTEPNPRVGCVIGTEQGRVLGRGATQRAGGPHAEVMALRDAESQGCSVRGATAWVTLEPCAHHGRTPPCCDALIAAGLKRVVVAVEDPFPQVAGAGLSRMRAAGLQVELADEATAEAAWRLNIGFFSRVMRKRPWVRVKMAASLDGFAALPDGTSQWITGPAARTDGHAWRKRASAILTGVGTVLADDPRLDVRLAPSNWQPLRVVVDSSLRTPPQARLLEQPEKLLFVASLKDGVPTELAATLKGAEVLNLPDPATGRVDLGALLPQLASRGVNELHVEAGPVLTGSLAQQGLVDEWLIYQAPKLLGVGRGMVNLPPLAQLDQAMTLRLIDATAIGDDLRLLLRPAAGGFERPAASLINIRTNPG